MPTYVAELHEAVRSAMPSLIDQLTDELWYGRESAAAAIGRLSKQGKCKPSATVL